MSLYRKNIFVGFTVLVALGLLGWMILRFADAPFKLMAKRQVLIYFDAVSAEGLSEGSPIYYLGVNVGRISKLSRNEDLRSVQIEALVDPPLPANVEGRIRTQVLGGGGALSLVLIPPGTTRPTDSFPEDQVSLQPHGSIASGQHVPAIFVGYDILPKEFTDLALELRRISIQFRESNLLPKLAATADSLSKNIDKAAHLVDSVNELVTDPTMRKDLRESMTHLREASESATRIARDVEALTKKADTRLDELAGNGNKLLASAESRVDEMAKNVGDRLTQLAKILETFESISRKVNEGRGTAALLVNDPALYENLLDTSKELKLTISDVKRLVEQWEQEGLYLKLNSKK